MSASPLSRPATSTVKDHAEWEEDRKIRHNVQVTKIFDPRFTKLISWLTVALLSLITAAICWASTTLIAVQRDVAVLIARPESMSKAEFDRNANRWDNAIYDLQRETSETRERRDARDAMRRIEQRAE